MTKPICYDGPPLWFLPEHLVRLCLQLPEDGHGVIVVSAEMSSGKLVNTSVIADRLIDLPAPYTARDIVTIRKLYAT